MSQDDWEIKTIEEMLSHGWSLVGNNYDHLHFSSGASDCFIDKETGSGQLHSMGYKASYK